MSKKLLTALLPLCLLLCLCTMLLWRLSDPREAGSVDYPLIGQNITQIDDRLADADLINIFASWCAPCTIEHPFFMQAQEKNTRIIGIAYKDSQENIENFLDRLGNPYTHIIHDETGELGLKLGITGVPETIALKPDGTIKRRFQGPLTAPTQIDELLK